MSRTSSTCLASPTVSVTLDSTTKIPGFSIGFASQHTQGKQGPFDEGEHTVTSGASKISPSLILGVDSCTSFVMYAARQSRRSDWLATSTTFTSELRLDFPPSADNIGFLADSHYFLDGRMCVTYSEYALTRRIESFSMRGFPGAEFLVGDRTIYCGCLPTKQLLACFYIHTTVSTHQVEFPHSKIDMILKFFKQYATKNITNV